MGNFSVFDISNADAIDSLHEELWNELVPDSGSCDSVQGELIRVMGRISSEMFRNMNNNWIYGKFEVNQESYPEGYMPNWDNDEYDEFIPDISKSTATQAQLDDATHFDDMLNFVKSWLRDHPLDEWDEKFQQKLQDALEMSRPNVPIGVISDEQWTSYIDEHATAHNEGWNSYGDENSEFANAQIVYWIYRNPDLMDINSKTLNKSVINVFEDNSNGVS